MDSPYSHELQVAIRAVQSAAKISQSVLSSDDKGTVEKADLSPVTIADFAIQALLTASVHGVFPDDAFVGEESAADLRENPLLLRRVWELLLRLRDDEAESLCKLPPSPEDMCDMIDRCGFGEPGGPESGRVWGACPKPPAPSPSDPLLLFLVGWSRFHKTGLTYSSRLTPFSARSLRPHRWDPDFCAT